MCLKGAFADIGAYTGDTVEGSEYETLRGCTETIRKDRPLVAFCVYHRKEDLFALPELLDEISDNG